MSPEQQLQIEQFENNIPDIEGAKFRKRARKKLSLFIEQDGKCCICDKDMILKYGGHKGKCATFEHVICKSVGGTMTRENVPLSHATCNSRRGNQKFEDFKERTIKNGGVPPKNLNKGEDLNIKARDGDMNAVEHFLAKKLEMALHLFKIEENIIVEHCEKIVKIKKKLEQCLDFGTKAAWSRS